MDKKYLKKYADLDFFDLPENGLHSKFLAFKYHSTYPKIESVLSELFICNKTSPYDKKLLSNSIATNYVILKDSVVQKFYNDEISNEELEDLKKSIDRLQTYFISLVIFPERHASLFGDFEKISTKMTNFIYSLKFDKINFVNLIGSFYIHPIWANKDRLCTTKIDNRFSLDGYSQKNVTMSEFNGLFNKYMPSSASVYSEKFPIYMRGNNLAENFERIYYICPHCNSFLSLYSEYSCIKCKECSSAFEFNDNYDIDLTNKFTNLDEAKKYQYDKLQLVNKIDDKMFLYPNIEYYEFSIKYLETINLSIYYDKVSYKLRNENIELYFKNIKDIYLTYNNTLKIKMNGENDYINLRGKNNENLYIIVDLYKIYCSRENLV